MFRGSDTLLMLGSDSNPLPMQLLDVMAGDGMLNSGGGVSGTLQAWEEHLVWMCLVYKRDQVAADGLTSAWRRSGLAFYGQSSKKEPQVMSTMKKRSVDISEATIRRCTDTHVEVAGEGL